MYSVVSICNMALCNMGITRVISSLSDSSQEARLCSAFYEHARDELLQDYPWNFAKASAALPLTTEASSYGGYVYALPESCLHVRRVYASGDSTSNDKYMTMRGASGGKVIVSDVADAWADYTYRVTDPLEFPPLWVEALAWKLSTLLTLPLKGDGENRRNDIMQYFLNAKNAAIVQDANECQGTERTDYFRDYIEVRG